MLLLPLKALAMRAAVLVNPRVHVEGLELVDISGLAVSPSAAERLQTALAVMGRADPRTLAGVKRRLRRIIVAAGEVGYYSPEVGAAVIGTSYLRRCSPEHLALVILHEATHARLHRLGIRTRASRRERIEQICINAELALARKLPEAESLIADIHAKAENPWWTTEVTSNRLASVAQASHMPNWVVRLVRKLPSWTDL